MIFEICAKKTGLSFSGLPVWGFCWKRWRAQNVTKTRTPSVHVNSVFDSFFSCNIKIADHVSTGCDLPVSLNKEYRRSIETGWDSLYLYYQDLIVTLSISVFFSIGGWINGLSWESEDGLTKYLQMAKSSPCRTYQWMQVRELVLHFSRCFKVTR